MKRQRTAPELARRKWDFFFSFDLYCSAVEVLRRFDLGKWAGLECLMFVYTWRDFKVPQFSRPSSFARSGVSFQVAEFYSRSPYLIFRTLPSVP